MPGLDTNVLVRWILDEEPRQAARAQHLFEEVSEQQLPLFVPSTVMVELEWVLRSAKRVEGVFQFDLPTSVEGGSW